MRVLERTLRVMQSRIAVVGDEAATVLIEPGLDPGERARGTGSELRSFRQGRRYIELGEAAAEAALPQLATALPWLRT